VRSALEQAAAIEPYKKVRRRMENVLASRPVEDGLNEKS
jgi:hypothetical protein